MAHSNLVQSLERGVKILNLVASSGTGMSLAEIATALQVQRPTAFNLTRTLVAHGYLHKTQRPVRFLLGPGVLDVAETWRNRQIVQHFENFVRDLADRLEGTVVVAEPLGGDVIAAHLVEKDRPGVVQHSASRRLTPYVHASTLCMMAFWSLEEAAAYRARYPFQDFGAGVWGTEQRLEKFLDEARDCGYVAWDNRDSRFLVGVPIYTKGGTLVAAVGVSLERTKVSTAAAKARVVRTVTEAVAEMSSKAYTTTSSASASRIAEHNS
jgi:DNA-binding IclR family transcriptional regulator